MFGKADAFIKLTSSDERNNEQQISKQYNTDILLCCVCYRCSAINEEWKNSFNSIIGNTVYCWRCGAPHKIKK